MTIFSFLILYLCALRRGWFTAKALGVSRITEVPVEFARNDEEVSLNKHLERGISFRFDKSKVELTMIGNEVVMTPKIRPVKLVLVESGLVPENEAPDAKEAVAATPKKGKAKKSKGKAEVKVDGRSKNKGRPPAKRDAQGNIMRDANGHPISSGPGGAKKVAKSKVKAAAKAEAPAETAPTAPVDAPASPPAPTPAPEAPKAIVTTEAPISSVAAPKP